MYMIDFFQTPLMSKHDTIEIVLAIDASTYAYPIR